jgi:ubiquinone/menaquinone biosynthesis C-methylase UbiE
VEVAAGTGRLTTYLVTRCAQVVAVEPSQPMRAILAEALSREEAGKVDIIDGFFDALPLPDASADLVVTCAALERDAAHGGDCGLAEMDRVCAPGGAVVVIWPNNIDWLRANGFTYQSFRGSMWMEFRDTAEAIEMTEIFYPHAAAEVRARGQARVGYDLLGVNPPRDLAFKMKSG